MADSSLSFASKYPFSKTAKAAVKNAGLNLESIDEPILKLAERRVRKAWKGEAYKIEAKTDSDVLENEILAFPVAKILVSLIDRFELNRKFIDAYAMSIFQNLRGEGEKSNKKELFGDAELFSVADELNIDRDAPKFAVTLKDYLRMDTVDSAEKLVNQKVSNGFVFLDKKSYANLISKIAAHDLKQSLSLITAEKREIPATLEKAAKSLGSEFAQTAKTQFSKVEFGEVAPDAFPPCMSKIYSELMNGVNVTHSGRFAIATFLASIEMPVEKIVDSFRRTPNFNESVTRYQVERIAGGKGAKYSCPSCSKMRSYNLCVANCPVSHPVQYYTMELPKITPKGPIGQKAV